MLNVISTRTLPSTQKMLRSNPEEIFWISEKSSKKSLFGGDFGGEGGKRQASWLLEKFLDFCSKATCKKLGKSDGQISRSYLELGKSIVIKCLKVNCFARGPSPGKTYRSVSGILPPRRWTATQKFQRQLIVSWMEEKQLKKVQTFINGHQIINLKGNFDRYLSLSVSWVTAWRHFVICVNFFGLFYASAKLHK